MPVILKGQRVKSYLEEIFKSHSFYSRSNQFSKKSESSIQCST